MKDIVLVTYHMEFIAERWIWLVYGHSAPGVNKLLGEYIKQIGALDKALEFDVPIMRGRNYDRVLEKLCK